MARQESFRIGSFDYTELQHESLMESESLIWITHIFETVAVSWPFQGQLAELMESCLEKHRDLQQGGRITPDATTFC